MGKKNNVICDYLEKPERFADFINGSLYGGGQVISAKEIEEGQTVYSKAARSRDILKKVCREGSYILIGVENQDIVHYAMPFRCMEYDVLEYKKQLKKIKEDYRKARERKKEMENRATAAGKSKEISGEDIAGNTAAKTAVSTTAGAAEFLSGMRKEDRLSPVITIVFYHGEDEYDGCRNLHDMLEFGKKNEIFKQYISDYHINLVTAKDLEEKNFRTGIRELIGFLKRRESKEELRKYCEENERRMREMDEDTFDVISIMINKFDFIEQKRNYRQEGERVDMCRAMEEWGEDLRKEGLERGIEAFVLDYLEEGFGKERIVAKLQKRFSLDEKKAEDFFIKYAPGLPDGK